MSLTCSRIHDFAGTTSMCNVVVRRSLLYMCALSTLLIGRRHVIISATQNLELLYKTLNGATITSAKNGVEAKRGHGLPKCAPGGRRESSQMSTQPSSLTILGVLIGC